MIIPVVGDAAIGRERSSTGLALKPPLLRALRSGNLLAERFPPLASACRRDSAVRILSLSNAIGSTSGGLRSPCFVHQSTAYRGEHAIVGQRLFDRPAPSLSCIWRATKPMSVLSVTEFLQSNSRRAVRRTDRTGAAQAIFFELTARLPVGRALRATKSIQPVQDSTWLWFRMHLHGSEEPRDRVDIDAEARTARDGRHKWTVAADRRTDPKRPHRVRVKPHTASCANDGGNMAK